MTNKINGVRTYRSGDTIFVPLPPALRRPIDGGCQCPHCTAHPERTPMWDTLAVSPEGEHAWTVHYPELKP